MINMNTLVFFLLFVVHATVQESLAHGCSKPTFRCQVFTRISELEHSSKALQDENMELKSLVENQQLEIEKLKKDAQSYEGLHQLLNEKNVAFYARMQTHNKHKSASQPLIFDDAVLNVGNGYNSSTSYFTAPVHGIYVFMCSIQGYNPNGANFNVNIIHNTDVISRFRSDGVDQISGNAILYLNEGDQVYLRVENGRNLWIFGNSMSTFAGFLQQ